jgi:hypothetical protein
VSVDGAVSPNQALNPSGNGGRASAWNERDSAPFDAEQSEEPSYRGYGCALVVTSAIALFVLGFVLQLVVYEFRDPTQTELPAMSKPLFNWFGLRPTEYLICYVLVLVADPRRISPHILLLPGRIIRRMSCWPIETHGVAPCQ